MNNNTKKNNESQINFEEFTKFYTPFHKATLNLSKISNAILHYLCFYKIGFDNNEILINKRLKVKMSNHFNLKNYKSVNKHIMILKDQGLLLKSDSAGFYILNPLYVWKGNDNKLHEYKYIKAYISSYEVTKDLLKSVNNLYTYLYTYHIEYKGKGFFLNKKKKDKIRKYFGFKSSRVIDKYISILKKKKLLLKCEDTPNLMFNPIHIWKGNADSRKYQIHELKRQGII